MREICRSACLWSSLGSHAGLMTERAGLLCPEPQTHWHILTASAQWRRPCFVILPPTTSKGRGPQDRSNGCVCLSEDLRTVTPRALKTCLEQNAQQSLGSSRRTSLPPWGVAFILLSKIASYTHLSLPGANKKGRCHSSLSDKTQRHGQVSFPTR